MASCVLNGHSCKHSHLFWSRQTPLLISSEWQFWQFWYDVDLLNRSIESDIRKCTIPLMSGSIKFMHCVLVTLKVLAPIPNYLKISGHLSLIWNMPNPISPIPSHLKSRSAGMSHPWTCCAVALVLACDATSKFPALPALPTNSLVLAYLAQCSCLHAQCTCRTVTCAHI